MIPLAGALLIGLTTAKPTYDLAWKPKKGEVHHYHIAVHFDYNGDVLDFTSDLAMEVLGVASDGTYRLSTRTTHAIAASGDDRQALPDEQPTEQRFDRVGRPILSGDPPKYSDPFSDLLDHLTEYQSPERPVAVGDSWVNLRSGPKTGWFGLPHITYRLANVAKGDKETFARISYIATVDLDPYAATGNLVLSMTDNHLVHMDVVIPHFKPENAGEEARVQVELTETG